MSQRTKILQALKSCLKAKGLTYKKIAAEIDLSEVSIKRIFSDGNVTLSRLEEICDIAGIDFVTLVSQAQEKEQRISELSIDQEKYLVTDTKRLLVAYFALNGWTMAQIIDEYKVTEHQCIKYLADLDRMGLIELQVNNRIRRKIAPNFSWRADGPIRAFYESQVKQEFFSSRFDQPSEVMHFLSGTLSPAATQVLKRKLDALMVEFNELVQVETSLPRHEKQGTSCVLALRGWEFSVFTQFERHSKQK